MRLAAPSHPETDGRNAQKNTLIFAGSQGAAESARWRWGPPEAERPACLR